MGRRLAAWAISMSVGTRACWFGSAIFYVRGRRQDAPPAHDWGSRARRQAGRSVQLGGKRLAADQIIDRCMGLGEGVVAVFFADRQAFREHELHIGDAEEAEERA